MGNASYFKTWGSSPRGRGARDRDRTHRCRPGLIPARAGSTCGRRGSWWSTRAHPRAGGEHGSLTGGIFGFYGSSPRGRGALDRDDPRPAVEGLIPARAGSTQRGDTARR